MINPVLALVVIDAAGKGRTGPGEQKKNKDRGTYKKSFHTPVLFFSKTATLTLSKFMFDAHPETLVLGHSTLCPYTKKL